MQLGRLIIVLAAVAAVLISLAKSEALALVIIGKGSPGFAFAAPREAQMCSNLLEERVARAEKLIKAFDQKLERNQRELRSARAALMIARLEALSTREPGVLEADLLRD